MTLTPPEHTLYVAATACSARPPPPERKRRYCTTREMRTNTLSLVLVSVRTVRLVVRTLTRLRSLSSGMQHTASERGQTKAPKNIHVKRWRR